MTEQQPGPATPAERLGEVAEHLAEFRKSRDQMLVAVQAMLPVVSAAWEALAPIVTDTYNAFLRLAQQLATDGTIRALAELGAQYEAARAAWEAEYPDVPFDSACSCWCAQSGHDPDECSHDAERRVPLRSTINGEPLYLYMCPPCAINAETVLSRGRNNA